VLDGVGSGAESLEWDGSVEREGPAPKVGEGEVAERRAGGRSQLTPVLSSREGGEGVLELTNSSQYDILNHWIQLRLRWQSPDLNLINQAKQVRGVVGRIVIPARAANPGLQRLDGRAGSPLSRE